MDVSDLPRTDPPDLPEGRAAATFGTGCFWCSEAIFARLEGVESLTPGFSGGHVVRPSYREVCASNTGHAEVVRIVFDPARISYEKLLEVFWTMHNPTTLNRQDHDVGPQYRSVIFTHDEKQRRLAEASKRAAADLWSDPVVTEIAPLVNFYEAEPEHRAYFDRHPEQAYCSLVIAPKVERFTERFREHLKAGVGTG